ncbi:MAG: RimK family protein [Alphaproteobacteria bacterium]|nr:RimK family protein [Alphaproteobacteria bacterium]MBU0805743.1 RimK family protein [Alphaproteobacteria bacterium]MBU0872480.1 RimK family protein [Alphaproteobacteria bacterium]MBU1402975.1 RimK family protein [Alphaproteobacteria bacterium]MBU1593736.1 RimK family protein [Alphaproteobacteria bacterium]
MSWVILTGRQSDLDQVATPHKIITNRDYLAHPALFRGQRPKVINLSSSYGYQSRGYYASLLASSRGHKVIPSVETIIDLSERKLYEHALPELELALNKCRKELGGEFPAKASFFFGIGPAKAWDRFAKLLFDWFRAPSLEVSIRGDAQWASIRKIGFLPVNRLEGEEEARFLASMETYTGREWRDTKTRTPARYTFATLVDPQEELPPSAISSLRHWARIAEKMGVEVEPITKKDLAKLANYDALFIRETTSISNHTYRFARRAQQEGMPVIDDPLSMIRCTNKVYLNELMAYNKVPVPPTVMIASPADFEIAAQTLGFPLVLKIPDSAFSRGVKKASSFEELRSLATQWLEDSDLLIAQKFMPTEFDWRVGVLGGQPLFAVHYLMAKQHWQIVNHRPGGKPVQGGFKSFTLKEAPPLVVETAVRAARCIGDGLYGVDLKETAEGVFVIEVNDNPNLDHGCEDSGEKDEVWIRLTQWFLDRLDRPGR